VGVELSVGVEQRQGAVAEGEVEDEEVGHVEVRVVAVVAVAGVQRLA